MRRFGIVVAAVAAATLVAPAFAGSFAYSDGEVRCGAPGPEWLLQTEVEGAPSIRAAFVRDTSVINIAIDGTPEIDSPVEYAKRTLAQLSAPPLGFKVRKSGEFTWKGNKAARAEYTDAAGKRFWAQATIKTPRGAMMVVTLQSPDAPRYGEDLKVFFKFLDAIDVAPAEPKKTP